MPRLPRKPSAPRPYGVGSVTAGWNRRRTAREPRIVVREGGGQPHAVDPEEPRGQALLDAAERLLSTARTSG
jgi:hypothetical protein